MRIIKYNLCHMGYELLEVICRIIGLLLQILRLIFSIIPVLPGKFVFRDKLMTLIDVIELEIVRFIYNYQILMILQGLGISKNENDADEIEI